MKKTGITALLGALILAVSGCGGGEGNDTRVPQSVAKKANGVITSANASSVTVNGVTYALTSTTSVSMDGIDKTPSDLQPGMVVTVTGRVSGATAGVADAIKFRDELEGVVLSAYQCNAVTLLCSMNVMGQTVAVTAGTIIYPLGTTADSIPVDAVVEVSGFPNNKGEITATRIEVKHGAWTNEALELKGTISALDPINGTFKLGSLIVSYPASATGLVDGLFVQVTADAPPSPVGVDYSLNATAVDVEDEGDREIDGFEGEAVQIYGMVTGANALAQTVEVNGQTFATPIGVFRDGLGYFNLNFGLMVRIEARLRSGVLVASEVSTSLYSRDEWDDDDDD